MLGSPVAEERKRRWRVETVQGVTEGEEDVSSRREDRRSEGESRDAAGRGGRTSQTRQVHAAQKRKDYSCDPFFKVQHEAL